MNFILIIFTRIWFIQKKAFTIQLMYSIITILVNACILSIFSLFLSVKLSLGFFLYLFLLLSNVARFGCVIVEILQCKRKGIQTRLQIRGKQNYFYALIITFVILQSVIILPTNGLGIYYKTIDINSDPYMNETLKLSFYASEVSYDYLTNNSILGVLNGSSNLGVIPAQIIMHVSENTLMDSNKSFRTAKIIQNCTSSGIDVYIWFYYEENGMYPSWEDISYLPVFKSIFDSWVANFALNITGIIMDFEFDQTVSEETPRSPFSSMYNLLGHKLETEKNWTETVDAYVSIMNDWRSTFGYEIGLVGMDMTLRDMDGDPDIQQMFGIINYPPETDYWDRASYMLYRHCEYHVNPNTQGYVFMQSRIVNKYYPENGAVAIGCTGSFPTYDTTDKILHDLALVKYTGIDTIELFEFQGFFTHFGIQGLQSVMNASKVGWEYPKFRILLSSFDYITFLGSYAVDVLMNFH
ncbi:MAG: hypothetical protein JW776_05005 [Candidatus Lokiarchaeota archaeon]|nr:hypothetical protein [Candidatus Lokiarchaeota archaeon]